MFNIYGLSDFVLNWLRFVELKFKKSGQICGNGHFAVSTFKNLLSVEKLNLLKRIFSGEIFPELFPQYFRQ